MCSSRFRPDAGQGGQKTKNCGENLVLDAHRENAFIAFHLFRQGNSQPSHTAARREKSARAQYNMNLSTMAGRGRSG